MSKFVTNLSPTAKSLVLLLFALWATIGLRLDVWHFPQMHAWWVYFLTSVVAIPIFIRIGLYRAVIRYIEAGALVIVVVGVTIAAGLLAAALVSPRSSDGGSMRGPRSNLRMSYHNRFRMSAGAAKTSPMRVSARQFLDPIRYE